MFRAYAELIRADLLAFSRSRVGMFWTVVFPLIVLFAYMHLVASPHLGRVSVDVQDLDRTAVSRSLISGVRSVLDRQDVVDVSGDGSDRSRSNVITLVIPAGLAAAVGKGDTTYVRASTQSAGDPAVRATLGVLRSALVSWSLSETGQRPRALLDAGVASAGGASSGTVDYVVAGLIVMIALSSTLMGFAVPLAAAREFGVARQQSLWPLPRGAILAALASSKLVIILASATALCLVARLCYGFAAGATAGAVVGSALVVMVATAALLAVGLAVAARAGSTQTTLVAANMLYFAGLFTGDILIPTGSLPDVVRAILTFSPVNGFAHALRSALSGGLGGVPDWSAVLSPLLIVSAVGCCAFAFAMRSYRWSDR